ncbi:hypothetical protein EXIGLDRAFT_206113 [Exidia glandulosa HHB12029]|uniref:Uncharacterized protein n=1 Tax=Exidia glandulosa HHB12029 TaxID=1314781 RepID=A0A165MWB0_EXIGL|nr:hypothetical protein EXIGLDRAFT_206113 [Exidia glandulosa HHB12029]
MPRSPPAYSGASCSSWTTSHPHPRRLSAARYRPPSPPQACSTVQANVARGKPSERSLSCRCRERAPRKPSSCGAGAERPTRILEGSRPRACAMAYQAGTC